jgi:hypothetical protein
MKRCVPVDEIFNKRRGQVCFSKLSFDAPVPVRQKTIAQPISQSQDQPGKNSDYDNQKMYFSRSNPYPTKQIE